MPPPLEPLQYKDVMEIWQKEKKTMSLTEVRHDFYPSLRELVAKLERDRETENSKDPYSAATRSLNTQLINIKEKASAIFDFRMEKILRAAVRGAGGGKADTVRMTSEERLLFEDVLGRTKGLRGDALGTAKPAAPEFQKLSAMTAEPTTMEQASKKAPQPDKMEEPVGRPLPSKPAEAEPNAPPAQPVKAAAPKIAEEVRPPSTEKVSEPARHLTKQIAPGQDIVLLRILEDIPPFAGPSGTIKLGREDVVTLPASIAKALVKRGKAVEIVPGKG